VYLLFPLSLLSFFPSDKTPQTGTHTIPIEKGDYCLLYFCDPKSKAVNNSGFGRQVVKEFLAHTCYNKLK